MSIKRQKVFVGMSGGVDSSVAALLLKRATPNNFEKLFGRPTPEGFRGYDVTGVYLKCWSQARLDELGVAGECPSEKDAEDARRVANHLGIPFYVFDFEEEYRQRVVEYLIDGYRRGITPNPDVVCNREIKFGLFMEKALSLGAEYVATGHYARVRHRASVRGVSGATPKSYPSQKRGAAPSFSLFEAKDKNKDQSYFLWTLTQKQLAHALFPVGDLLKSEVRDIARKAGLPTADKKDSQGICFLGDVALADFVARHIPDRPGDVIATNGTKVGEHRGTHLYTIGQRHGLNLGKKTKEKGNAETPPYYISAIDVEKNVVMVAEGTDNPALFRTEVTLANVNFINGSHSNILKNVRMTDLPSDGNDTLQHANILQNVSMSVLARVRYRQPLVRGELVISNTQEVTGSSLPITSDRVVSPRQSRDNYCLLFTAPVKFIAPGQSAVWYSEDGEMLGGGIIT
ncbi:MAG: tRNA 2-thiouridine(34) synthase MnmA [bacterium]|nr:tRNA 2-thiouridine(34) synthase MnmA [bacterium]